MRELLLAQAGGSAIVRRGNAGMTKQGFIQHAAANAALDTVQVNVGGDDCGQAPAVTMIEQLVEFFAGPGARVFGAKVVEDEQLRAADALELFVVTDFRGRAEGAAQVVQQVRRGDKQDHVALRQPFVADGGRQVGFATAIGAGEDEPAFRGVGKVARAVAGKLQGAIFFGADLRARYLEVVEALVGVGLHVAEAAQTGLALQVAGRLQVRAAKEPAEIGVVPGDVVAQYAQSATQGHFTAAIATGGISCR